MSKLFVPFFLFTTYFSSAFSFDCTGIASISYLQDGQRREIKQKVCSLNNSRSFISAACLKKCQVRTSVRLARPATSGIGSPSHLECREFGGKPLIAKVSLADHETVLCLFEDGSFATTDLLGGKDAF